MPARGTLPAIDPAGGVRQSARPFTPGPSQPQMTASAASLTYDRRTILAFAALVLGAVAMGASPLFVRLADVGPYASAFWRCALALPFFALWAHYEKGGLAASWRGIDRAVDPVRRVLRRRSVLLASVDPRNDGCECDLLRHHRADLGRARRVAPAQRKDRRAHHRRACALPARRRGAWSDNPGASRRIA